MKFLDRLERRFGQIYIEGLMRIVVAGMALVFVCNLLFPAVNLTGWLYFSPALIMRGQIWRIVTFIFLPPSDSLIFIIFSLYFYYLIGNTLESRWGSFRFNVYYLIGMIGTIIAGFIAGGADNSYLNLSLFFAFAAMFPDMQVLLFFIIPIKIKWLALLDAALFAWQFVIGGWAVKAEIIASLLNFLIFFGPTLWKKLRDWYRYRGSRDTWNQMRR